jgi:hypothetical protein
MKTIYLKIQLIVVLTILFSATNADTYHSTVAGGEWDESTTWQEGSVPAPTDDVVIISGAEVIIHESIIHECNNITVENGAILINRQYGSRTLLVHGNIINNGTIQDSNYDLTIYLEGDFTHDGIASCHLLRFTGENEHNVVFGADAKFSGENFQAADTTGTVHLASDIIFSGTDVNFNFVELDGNGFSIKMEEEAFFDDILVRDFTIAGNTIIYDGTSFAGNVIVQDTLFKPQYHNLDLNIDGNLTNNGVITKPNYTLDIYITGDIVNNGEWLTSVIHFTGTTTQTISAAAGKEFTVSGLEDDDINSTIEALSDLTFNNAIIDLVGGSMEFVSSNTLTMNNGTLRNAYLNMNGGTLFMENDAELGANLNISDLSLDGIIQVHGNSIVFAGEIINNAYLRNYNNSYQTLTIDGNITNNDTITDPNYSLDIIVTGNIVNNGVWSNLNTRFNGASTHTIYQDADAKFEGANFQAEAGTGTITALTDLEFANTTIDLNGGTLIMPVSKGGTLSISNGNLQDGSLTGNHGTLLMEDESDLGANLNISDVTLDGVVQVHASTIVLTGEIINNAYLRNYNNNYETLTIEGNLTNNDTITDPNYSLTIHITGNIINNGVWSNEVTQLTGSGTHEISQGPGAKFSGTNFQAEAGTGTITALTDLEFTNTTINLNGGTLIMPDNKGGTLSIFNGTLQDGSLTGNHGTLLMEDGSDLGANLNISDVMLDGVVQVHASTIVLTGEIINNSYLRNYNNNNETLTIEGNLVNNDTISNPNYSLTIHVTGNIINNGVWSNEITHLTGTGTHEISQGPGARFSSAYFESETGTGVITVTSDLTFYKTNIDFNGCELQMTAGKRLSILGLSGSTCVLSNGTIGGEPFELKGNSDARFQNIDFDADVSTFGELRSYGTDNHFLQSLSVQDTLTSCTNNYSSIQVDGRIVNNGLIMEANYHFSIKCMGHIINNGTWINHQTTLNGVDDQLIYLIAGKEITGEFRFLSDIDDPPYQWKHNGVDLNSEDFTGETAATLVWNVPVSNSYWGYFGCQGASDTTRNILIRSGIIIDPVVQLQGPYNGVDMDTDLAEQGLIPLQQPFNMPPWNYEGGEEVASIPVDIVDWVLVELRETSGGPETATAATMVLRRALMLRNDGRVVDPWNQTPELKYDIDLNDNIYMVVWHRNHLGVMTAVPISDGDSPAYFNFSESAAQAYGGSDALIDLGNGKYGMMGGDADYNQQVTTQDKLGFWDPNVGMPIGYDAADFTLDGQIDNQDKNQTWVKTIGASTQVPQ